VRLLGNGEHWTKGENCDYGLLTEARRNLTLQLASAIGKTGWSETTRGDALVLPGIALHSNQEHVRQRTLSSSKVLKAMVCESTNQSRARSAHLFHNVDALR
jgi:hypothetical protein